MQGASGQSVLLVVGLVLAGAGFISLVLLINAILSPRKPSAEKVLPYECGMPPSESVWSPYNVRFATIALLFVIFDAEAVLLFAMAPGLRGSLVGVVQVALFVAFLAFGLVYAWRKGALRWPS